MHAGWTCAHVLAWNFVSAAILVGGLAAYLLADSSLRRHPPSGGPKDRESWTVGDGVVLTIAVPDVDRRPGDDLSTQV